MRFSERADAVLAAWFLGSEAGAALADILTGAVCPAGKLPVTWPRAMGQIPIFYAQRPTGRPADPVIHETGKYIDMPVTPYFPFGHGLSFTEFTYANLRARLDKAAGDFRITIEVDITNSGAFEGEETCFLFIRDCVASVARPVIELRGIAKLRLAPGSTATASFGLSEADLAFPGADGTPQLELGRFRISCGSLRGQRQAPVHPDICSPWKRHYALFRRGGFEWRTKLQGALSFCNLPGFTERAASHGASDSHFAKWAEGYGVIADDDLTQINSSAYSGACIPAPSRLALQTLIAATGSRAPPCG